MLRRQLVQCDKNPICHRGESMQLKFLCAMVAAFALSLGAMAQQDNGGIKQDTKDAAHSTGNAVKKTGHKIKKGTKKVVQIRRRHGERRRQSERQECARPDASPTKV